MNYILNEQEILRSKHILEEAIDRKIQGFAYPYGKENHYKEDTVSYVKKSGFKYACSKFKGLIGNCSDLYQLPRLAVMDLSGENFMKKINYWKNKFKIK